MFLLQSILHATTRRNGDPPAETAQVYPTPPSQLNTRSPKTESRRPTTAVTLTSGFGILQNTKWWPIRQIARDYPTLLPSLQPLALRPLLTITRQTNGTMATEFRIHRLSLPKPDPMPTHQPSPLPASSLSPIPSISSSKWTLLDIDLCIFLSKLHAFERWLPPFCFTDIQFGCDPKRIIFKKSFLLVRVDMKSSLAVWNSTWWWKAIS